MRARISFCGDAADFFNSILGFLRIITGENWNNIMHDASIEGPYCVENSNFMLTDCGSPSWYSRAAQATGLRARAC